MEVWQSGGSHQMEVWHSGTVAPLWHSGGSHQGSIRSQPGLRQCIDAYLEPDLTLQTTLSNTQTTVVTPTTRPQIYLNSSVQIGQNQFDKEKRSWLR